MSCEVSPETLRGAIIYLIKNPKIDPDNVGLGFAVCFLLGVVPVSALVAICCTVYYSLKLWAP